MRLDPEISVWKKKISISHEFKFQLPFIIRGTGDLNRTDIEACTDTDPS